MSYGYSQSLVQANKEASAKSLGVALGRLCIRHGISVARVTRDLNVSRMTVYNWFKGQTDLSKSNRGYAELVQRYIEHIKKNF
jgi:hypothetical protein